MKIDIYHLYRHFDYTNFGYPIIINVLKVWAQSIGWNVRVFSCKEKDVDLNADADVVAFSVFTQMAPAVYRLSEKLREKGKITIFGGPHYRGPNYIEGLEHCDILTHSICEEQWINLLREIEDGKIQPGKNHRARVIMDAENKFCYPGNFYETFKEQTWYHVTSVPVSLGCPYDCSFCNPFMQGEYRVRDIKTIYNELANTPKWKPVFLADATFGLNKRHTIELMKTISPLKRKLYVESTLKRFQDLEFLDALAGGGVKWITVGIESFNSQINKLGKDSLKDNINRLLDNAHERGMMVEGNFICGLDSDGPGSLDDIYEFYTKSSIDLIIIDILTPYPNTRLFYDLQREGRIIDTDWEHYDYRHVVYRPKRMSVNQLIDGFNQLYKGLYSFRRVLKNIKSAYSFAGISTQMVGVTLYNGFSIFDRRRKEKALNRNKDYVPGLLKANRDFERGDGDLAN